MSSPNTFDETGVSHVMVDGVCYINGEELVSHLKTAVANGVDEVIHMISTGQLNMADYYVAQAAITGMAGDILPPTGGFFFGTYDIDEWYIRDMQHTVKALNHILLTIPADNWDWSFIYKASW